MVTDSLIQVLVLEEFRLRAADLDGAAARIVARSPQGIEQGIPLLTSIDDRRDVATLRGVHAGESLATDPAQHAALDSLVLRWTEPKHYGPRITERSQSPPSTFRLAVTESGTNVDGGPRPSVTEGSVDRTTSRPVGLLWIGTPLHVPTGLLVLLGGYEDDARAVTDSALGWPLSFSRDLGVRIYESSRT
ncbi:MAG: hypothetical protein AUI15_07200 [Actinobacteria bacterium 13_2_20CM_2_66_6]|nr:MAG: hypothetical protein AUI15_07200 [Actinobacteria bacterium 13_2_20CM_2_66_6]